MDAKLEQIVAEWLDYLKLERRRAPRTLAIYHADLMHFANFWQSYAGERLNLQRLPTITIAEFRAWLAARVKEEFAASTNRGARVALRSFFKFLHKRHKIENAAIFALRSQKKPKSLPRAITAPQVETSLTGMPELWGESWMVQRDMALFTLLYGAGLRISEALSLTIGDVGGTMLKVTGKGSKERVVPLLAEIREPIARYLQNRPYHGEAKDPLFIGEKGKKLMAPVFRKRLQKMRNLLNLPEHLTPHALRHSFATHMLAGGADLRVIQECLGHASLSTTQIYASLQPEQLTSAYQKLFPRK